MRRARTAILLSITLGTIHTACARPASTSVEPATSTSANATPGQAVQVIPPLPLPRTVRPADEPAEPGLRFRAAVDESAPAPAPVPPARTGPLAAHAINTLLSRLPALPVPEERTFRFPTASPPPPRAGALVLAGLAGDTAPPRPDAPPVPEPLRVLRIVPEGQAGPVPHVTVTFSRPMVPLTDIEAVDAHTPPVRLTPAVAGRWTWIDPRTARFVAEPRLPMATRFEVEVPAGTMSLDGSTLGAAVRTSFETPAPRAVGGYPALHPDAPDRRDPVQPMRVHMPAHDAAQWARPTQVMLVAFDQQVEPAAVLRTARLVAGAQAHAVRLATAAELAADSTARLLADSARAGTWVAFVPAAPLPLDADVRLVLAAGTASMEGPLESPVTQEMRFRTYGPLRLLGHDCYGDQECRPGQPWRLRFSNPIDTAAWTDAWIRIEPSLPDLSVVVHGADVVIRGDTRRSTRYSVNVDSRVRDVFGQRLARAGRLRVDVASEEPTAALSGAPMIVLDPGGPPVVTVRSVATSALRVRVHRVVAGDFPAFRAALAEWQRDGVPPALPGRVVVDRTMDVPGGDGFAETRIDVAAALTDGLGHAVVMVEPVAGGTGRGPRGPMRSQGWAWVQSTRIGVHAAVDREDLLAWATSLETGRPIPGVAVHLLPSGARGVTDAQGLATVPLRTEPDHLLVAERDGDTAILPEQPEWHTSGWAREPGPGELRWYVFTDRGLYQPGETARLKGWVRLQTRQKSPSIELPRGLDAIAFQTRGPRGEEVARGRTVVGGLAGFDLAIELPDALNLGHAGVELTAEGPGPFDARSTYHPLRVQEFRRPEYEVAIEAEAGPYVAGDVVRATLAARYYGGGGLSGATVQWQVLSRPGFFTPPGWQGWQFGRPPWTITRAEIGRTDIAGTTDAGGEHRIRVDLLDVDPPFASMLRIAGQVQDVSRQVGSGSVELLVHPAAVHVGLRLARSWSRPGERVPLEVIVTDHEGTPVPGRDVQVSMQRTEWLWRQGRMVEDTAAAQTVCSLTSGTDPQSCTLEAAAPGLYRLRADVRDDAGRTSRTEHVFRVAGGSGLWRPGEDRGEVQLVADRAEYQPGDTARILLSSPFHPAEALLTLRSAGVVTVERFRVDSAARSFSVRLLDEFVPGVTAHVELVDSTGLRHASGEVRLAVPPHRHRLEVQVTPAAELVRPGAESWVDIEVRSADGRPTAGAEVAVWMVDESILGLGDYHITDPLEAFFGGRWSQVRDHASRSWLVPWPRSAGPGTVSGTLLSGAGDGQGIPGAVVSIEGLEHETQTAFDGSFTLRGVSAGRHVLVVRMPDGALLRRTIEVPAAGVHLGSIVATAGGEIVLAPQMEQAALRAAGPVAVAPLPPPPPPAPAGAIEVRSDFGPLAFFEPAVRTDAQGRARVRMRLPGTLTRYRVMAVAVAGADRFGTGEATVTARRDLMVRISAPRFLNHGDRFELPVLVQNVTGRALDVDVAVRAAGLALEPAAGRRVSLPAGERAEVRFSATAARPGSAHVQAVAAASTGTAEATDAAAIDIPVYTPATTEAFALHGTIDDGAPVVLPVTLPQGIISGFGGLDVSLTSTALHALADAVLYLKDYPFEGSEQVASRLLATVALRDVLHAFAAPGLQSREEATAAAQRDIARLAALQTADGGWGFWRPGEPSHPFVSVHVAHALQRAAGAGYDVPRPALDRSLRYLRDIDSHARDWPLRARQTMQAYALHVRHRMGDREAVAHAQRLLATPVDRVGGELGVDAMAWLVPVLAADPGARADAVELLRRIGNRVDETAGTATFAERYTDGEHLLLHSSRRTDAIALDALVTAEPSHDLIPKLAQSLLAHRVSGRWRSTQENVWVLLALERYFSTFERTEPDFRAGIWLGPRYAGGHAFSGRSTERATVTIPLTEVARTPSTDVTLAKEGEGRLYYRAALQYAPADPRTPPRERGFAVTRVYEAIDDPADVRRDDDGTWRIRAGARVRVTLTMVAPSVRYHVALVDPLPAGLEPLNPELRGTGLDDTPPPGRPQGRPVWWPRWFMHQNLRDDRAEAFATFLPAGSYEYAYTARATTPGTFVAAPPRAEMMYEPETFGRGEGARVVIE